MVLLQRHGRVMPGIDPTPVGEILVGGRVSGDDGLWVHGFSAAPPRTLLGRPRGTMDEVDQILDDLHGRGWTQRFPEIHYGW
jgi:hypothetical protein